MLGVLWLIILLATGYLLTYFLFKKQDFLERFICGVALSITLLIFSGFLLNFFTITSFTVRLAVSAAFVLTILFLIFTKRNKLVQRPKFELKHGILILCCVIVFLFAYSLHFTYRFPLHTDEYFHMSFAQKIMETGHLYTNPYNNSVGYQRETGFHIILANLFLLSNLDPLLNYKFLPAIFAVFTSLVIFVFIYELTKNFWTGSFGMLLFATLKSNMRVEGIMVAAPFIMSLSLDLLFLFLIFKWSQEKKPGSLILAAILLLTILAIHPSAAAYLLFIAMFYFVGPIKKEWKVVLAEIAITLVCAIIIMKRFVHGFWEALSNIVARAELYYVIIEHPDYFRYIGIPLAFFVLLGLYHTAKIKKERILAIFFIPSIIYLYVVSIIEYSHIIRTERLLYLTLTVAIILGSIGISYFLKILKKKIRQRHIFVAITVLILIAVFYFQLKGYFNPKFVHIMDEEEYQTIKLLKANYSGKHIFAHSGFSMAIPFSGNSVVTYWIADLKLAADAVNFFEAPSCEQGKTWVDTYHPALVVSRKPLPCDYLHESKSNETGYFIYEVRKEN